MTNYRTNFANNRLPKKINPNFIFPLPDDELKNLYINCNTPIYIIAKLCQCNYQQMENKIKSITKIKKYYDPDSIEANSLESKIKSSSTKQGIDIEDWDGFVGINRSHILPLAKCIKLNPKFEGSHAHHITSGIIIYIPKDLHYSVNHNMKTGKNIKEINHIAWNYLLGNF